MSTSLYDRPTPPAAEPTRKKGGQFTLRDRPGVVWLVLAVTGAPLLVQLVNGVHYFGRVRPELWPGWTACESAEGRRLAQTGGTLFLLQVFALAALATGMAIQVSARTHNAALAVAVIRATASRKLSGAMLLGVVAVVATADLIVNNGPNESTALPPEPATSDSVR